MCGGWGGWGVGVGGVGAFDSSLCLYVLVWNSGYHCALHSPSSPIITVNSICNELESLKAQCLIQRTGMEILLGDSGERQRQRDQEREETHWFYF